MTRALGWLTALALIAGLGAAFGYAPREAVQQQFEVLPRKRAGGQA